ncbi:cadherin-like beta sandwich domain-containing protein, partial [Paenibacillus sinopodophylli]|uniref:cadherin-like beta sandwich domain-containing protein n=1 Tax=Paenibacillus sinopodophylli TaxID=1837342 RepID=UPI0014860AA1
MDIIRSSTGMRKKVRPFLAIVLFIAIMVQLLSSFSQTAFAASSWRMGAGAGHPSALGFEPFGMDVDPVNGYLFVTDESTFTVKIYDLDGNTTGMTLTASPGNFAEPLAVKFDGAGHVYVTDKWYVYRFDVSFSSGSYTFNNMIKWDGNSTVPSVGRLSYPQGIAVYGNDLYIADTNADRVLKFDVSTFSSTSNPVVWSGDLDPDPAIDATIDTPFGIAADSSGVFIGNNVGSTGKIIKWKTDGSTLIKAISRPKGLRLHSDGYLYVALNGSNGSLVTRFDSSLNEDSVYFTGNASAIAPANIGFDYTGALYLSTYAQSPPYDPEYDTIWKQSLGSPDNRLSTVTASGISLSPAPFSPNTLEYTASVASSVTSTMITPVLSDSSASVTVNGTSVPGGIASSPIVLSKGDNTVPVVVTAINGATRNYTIKVTRAPYTDSALSGLAVSPGLLNETFAAGTLTYTASVANSVTSFDVTPTVNNSRAMLKVNNTAATSGSASTVSSLTVGPNTITVNATAEDGTTVSEYTII